MLESGVENLKWSVSGRESEGGMWSYGIACSASESRARVLPPRSLPGEKEGILLRLLRVLVSVSEWQVAFEPTRLMPSEVASALMEDETEAGTWSVVSI